MDRGTAGRRNEGPAVRRLHVPWRARGGKEDPPTEPLALGSPAPDFELADSKGGRLRLSSLRGRKVVLYFFPKAFTAGCAAETRAFATLAPALAGKGVEIVGISVDAAEVQTRFAGACQAAFPIVSDASKEVARAYGVLSFIGLSKRVTFFLDEKGVVRDVVAGLRPAPHVERARERYLATA